MAGKKLYFSGLLNFDPPETISGRFKNETVPPWGSKTTSKKKSNVTHTFHCHWLGFGGKKKQRHKILIWLQRSAVISILSSISLSPVQSIL